MEESDKNIDLSIKRAKSSLKTNAYIFETCYSWTQITEFGTQELHECSSEFFFSSEGPSGSGSGSVGYSNDNVDYIMGNSGSGNGNGGPGNGGEDSDDKPFDLPDIINDLNDYPCASSVLEQFTNFKSTISNILRDVFDFDISMNITFEVDEKLSGTSTDATASQNSDIDFIIRMNPDVLNNATQEYIAVTFAHEVIHSLISYYSQNNPDLAKKYFPIFVDYRDSNTGFLEPPTKDMRDYELNKQHHETMANKYINAMKEVVLKLNSSFPEKNAIYLAWGGLQGTWVYELKKMASLNDSNGNNIWEGKVSSANQQERNSSATSKGTKCIN